MRTSLESTHAYGPAALADEKMASVVSGVAAGLPHRLALRLPLTPAPAYQRNEYCAKLASTGPQARVLLV